MTLSQFITFLRKQAGGAARADILDMLNIAHNEAMTIDNSFTRIKPDPSLTTSDDVYEYSGTDISSYNIRRVGNVYTNQASYYSNNYFSYPFSHIDLQGHSVYNVPVMTVDSAHPSSRDVKIIFPSTNNPGNTQNVYFIEAFVWPQQLISESITPALPLMFWNKVLAPRVLDMLEIREYGNGISNINRWQDGMKEWIGYANKSLTNESTQIQYRDV